MTSTRLSVTDMACSACLATITQTIHSLDASAQVQGDLVQKIVTIESNIPAQSLQDAILAAGYSVTVIA